MTMEVARDTLMWCLIINVTVLLCWWLFFTMAHEWVYKTHGRWFKLSVETFDAMHYAGMMAFKLCIIAFNLAPYVALLIIGCK
jgi:NO-binding membrane sensor protein with MHYT domain